MSVPLSGFVIGAMAVSLVALADRTQKQARKNADGWRVLQAGWLLNGLIVACAGFAALMGYITEVGSSRPDADAQMLYGLLLVIGFGGTALYLIWIAYGRTIMWKGDTLRVRTISRREIVRRISDICRVRKSEAMGEYHLTFRDGSTLRLSAHLRGAGEFVSKLPARAARD
jgi:hypothetical protein